MFSAIYLAASRSINDTDCVLETILDKDSQRGLILHETKRAASFPQQGVLTNVITQTRGFKLLRVRTLLTNDSV